MSVIRSLGSTRRGNRNGREHDDHRARRSSRDDTAQHPRVPVQRAALRPGDPRPRRALLGRARGPADADRLAAARGLHAGGDQGPARQPGQLLRDRLRPPPPLPRGQLGHPCHGADPRGQDPRPAAPPPRGPDRDRPGLARRDGRAHEPHRAGRRRPDPGVPRCPVRDALGAAARRRPQRPRDGHHPAPVPGQRRRRRRRRAHWTCPASPCSSARWPSSSRSSPPARGTRRPWRPRRPKASRPGRPPRGARPRPGRREAAPRHRPRCARARPGRRRPHPAARSHR